MGGRKSWPARLLALASVLFLAAVAATCFAESLIYLRIDRAILEKRTQMVPPATKDRLATLRTQFRNAGCGDHLQEQPVPGTELPNLICTLQGNDTGVILIAASLDYNAHGDEERVQWATLELLPLLAESLNSSPHRETLVFAAFTGHDHSFAGSNLYLTSLTDVQREKIRAMIYLDHLGRVPTAYTRPMRTTSSRTTGQKSPVMYEDPDNPNPLITNIRPAVRALNLPATPRPFHISDTDSRVFAENGVLAINFHSPAYTSMPIIGDEYVRMLRTELDPAVYADTYNFLCAYVLLVDKALDVNRAGLAAPRPD